MTARRIASRVLGAAWALCVASCSPMVAVKSGVLMPERLRQVSCIAVVPFENQTRAQKAGALVAQEVASALLRSEQLNVLGPSEVKRLLELSAVTAPEAIASQRLAQKVGEVLGVHAVLVGSVTAFEGHDFTPGVGRDEATVAFNARLVDAVSGEVLWTAATSHFEQPLAVAVPETKGQVLRQAVGATLMDLVEGRGQSADRGLCAAAYVRLDRGEPPAFAGLDLTSLKPAGAHIGAHLSAPLVSAETAADVTAASWQGGASEPASDAASMPIDDALPSIPGDGLPAIPGDLASEPAHDALPAMPGDALPAIPGGDALPAMPSGDALPAIPGGDALPGIPGDALPAMPGGEAFPPMPGGDGLPAIPGDALPAMPGDALPAIPGGEALPAIPGAIDEEPAAKPPRTMAKSLTKKLKGKARGLAKQLYRPGVERLPIDVPAKSAAGSKLLPRTKGALDQLGAILKAERGLRVRITVHTDVKGNSNDAAMQALSEQQADAAAAYLQSRYGIGADRATLRGVGRSQRVKGAGAPANTRLEVVVLQYP